MKKNRYIILLIAFLSSSIYASDGFDSNVIDLFTPSATDLSINYLRMLFGTVGNVLIGQGDQLIAKLFNIFNMGLMVFAGGFISYTIFRSVINTAQDGGGAAGQGKGNAWPTFRIILGVSLLMPMYQGYSMAQVTTMWSVVQGVGLADRMWEEAADKIASTGGALLAPPHSELYSDMKKIAAPERGWLSPSMSGSATMTDLMASSACLAILSEAGKALIEEDQKTSGTRVSTISFQPQIRVGDGCIPGSYRQPDIPVNNVTVKEQTICFGVRTAPSICGSYTWSQDSLKGIQADISGVSSQAAFSYFSTMQSTYQEIIKFLEDYSDGSKNTNFLQLQGARNALLDANQNKVFMCSNAGTCYQSLGLASFASQYYSSIKSARALPEETKDMSEEQAWARQAKANGWITAGQSYHRLITTPNQSAPDLQGLDGFLLNVGNSLKDFDEFISSDVTGCILSRDDKAIGKDLVFKNIGPTIGQINGSQSNGGQITIKATDKHAVAACILWGSLKQYADFAHKEFDQIESSTLQSRLGGGQAPAPADAVKGTEIYDINSLTNKAFNTFLNMTSFGSGPYNNESANNIMLKSKAIKLNVAQDNLRSMLVSIFGRMLGFFPFAENTKGTSLASVYSDGSKNADGDSFTLSVNPACLNASTDCKPDAKGNISADCFYKAWAEHKCIQKGAGILGSIASSQSGESVDQLLILTNLGLEMLNNSVLYFTQTTSGIYRVMQALVKNYTDKMITINSTLGSVGAGMEAFGKAWGGLFSILASAGSIMKFGAQLWTKILMIDFNFDSVSLGIYLPFGASLALLFFTLGVTLGVYLPLIPFLTFLFAAIGWLIAVVEAMVAAPLVALGVTHPAGHDLLGKAEQSIILLLGIFVRPAAMLIGFILAVVLSFVAMEMLNTGFISVMINYLNQEIATDGSLTAQTALVGFCGILLVYVYTALSVINQAFSMVYQVPDKLLRWIGGAPEQSSVGQMLQEVKSSGKEAAQTSGQGASQTASQTPHMQPQSVEGPDLTKGVKEKEGKAE